MAVLNARDLFHPHFQKSGVQPQCKNRLGRHPVFIQYVYPACLLVPLYLAQTRSIAPPMTSNSEEFLGGRVIVIVADLTEQPVDAIVNAANSSLMGGRGVDGAIHRAGGPAILEACREIRQTQYPDGLPTGEAVITTAGKLPAKFVIHTVGPVYGRHGGREAELLAACYRNSLQLAADHSLSSNAFPAISTGVFGYPLSEAAAVSSEAVRKFLMAEERSIREVRLVFFKKQDAEIFVAHQKFE
jgi:O-acetyl-ADP-ribose deacetylase (regulator of RNase III)